MKRIVCDEISFGGLKGVSMFHVVETGLWVKKILIRLIQKAAKLKTRKFQRDLEKYEAHQV